MTCSQCKCWVCEETSYTRKKNLIVNANGRYTTALDNGASTTVVVHYRPKSVCGEKKLSIMTNSVSTIQTVWEVPQKEAKWEAYRDKRNVGLYQSVRRQFQFRISVFGMSKEWSGISHPIIESMQYLIEGRCHLQQGSSYGDCDWSVRHGCSARDIRFQAPAKFQGCRTSFLP